MQTRQGIDPTTVEDLLELLQESEMTWSGGGHRARAIEQLRQVTGQDLGYEPAAWLSWWGAVSKVLTCPKPASQAPSSRAALAALREMGVVEEAELTAWTGSFAQMLRGLAFYLASCDGPSLRIAHASARCWTEPQRRALEMNLNAFVERGERGPARGVVEETERGEVLCRLDEIEMPLGEYPARGIFRALTTWSRRRLAERELWLDAHNRLWWLNEANVVAIRRYGVLRLRRIHPREPGAPHAEVEAAWRRLERMGLRLSRARPRLGWEVDLFDEALHPRRHSYETQLLDLEGSGVLVAEIDLGTSLDASSLAERLSRVVGVTLDVEDSDELFDLRELLAHFNQRLGAAASGLRLVALRSRLHWVRIMPLPVEAISTFAERVEVIAGLESSHLAEARREAAAPLSLQHS